MILQPYTLCHEVSIGNNGTTLALVVANPALCVACHDALEAASASRYKALRDLLESLKRGS